MSVSEEVLNKLVSWDLKDDITGCEDPQYDKVYRQLQNYFKSFFGYFENISRISRQLNVVVQDFIHESGQVEQVAAFLKKGAEQQTLDIKQSAKLVEDFTDQINDIYAKSQDIISLAYDMEKTNQGVQESVDQLVLNQAKNDEAVRGIFEVVRNLIDKTQRIGEITKLINRISSETNLLGLNAKVEAARAGAAGRGFSVVADEIQRLSQESKTASVNISDTIMSVTDEISLLEKVAQKSQDTFKAQRDSVDEVSTAFEKNSEFINTYISEQKNFNTSIEKIKNDENVLVSSISNIFSSVREVSATAHEISSLTYNQNNSISLLGKLDTDLAGNVASLDRQSGDIQIEKVSAGKKKIAIIFDNENPFFDPTKREALKAADTYNYDIAFYAPKSRGVSGINEMGAILDSIIEQKADGLVISPIDDDLIYQKLKKISSMGTKIVFINSKIDHIDYVSYIQTNGIAAGAAAARVVMGAMGSQGEVIVNSWTDTHISAIEDRRSGFVQELRKHTGIEVHEVPVKSKPAQEEADKAIRSMLSAYPNARFVFLTNCDWGLIFANYMRRYRPNVEVVVIDFTKEIQDLMSSGQIHYALGQRNYSWGSMAMNFIDKSFSGKPVQKYVDTGTFEVNRQNMSIYKSMA
jgi:methyl-accepting chemotaxis protein/DNA-binding LacI/PurR family transcriptional regulator